MFMRLSKNGHNAMSMLWPGEYHGTAKTYVGQVDEFSFTLLEWAKAGSAEIVCAEWLAVAPNGDMLYCDYLKLPDGRWRDSDGKTSQDLNSLLPGDFEGLVLVEEISAGTEILSASEGRMK